MAVEVIYVRGGDKEAPTLAAEAGMKYGTRADYKAYSSVYMLDVDFHRFEPDQWPGYMAKVHEYQPFMALAPDYGELPKYTVTRRELYGYIRDLKCAGVVRILVCPKFPGAIAHIPSWCVIALSVPAPSYAGYLPQLTELRGRNVHLLGGSVHKQADLICKITGAGGRVVSVDGSHHAMAAGHGRWFDGAYWHQLRRNVVPTRELEAASSRAIVKYLRRSEMYVQPQLF